MRKRRDTGGSMSKSETELMQCLVAALALPWEDNGNIRGEAVRDYCLDTLARTFMRHEFLDLSTWSVEDVVKYVNRIAEKTESGE